MMKKKRGKFVWNELGSQVLLLEKRTSLY